MQEGAVGVYLEGKYARFFNFTPNLCFLFLVAPGYCILCCICTGVVGCIAALFGLPPTHNVQLGFENLLEVTDWVHTLLGNKLLSLSS